MKSKMFGMVGLLGALVVSGFGSTVVAQGALQIGGNRANFGRRPVAPGFVPDPIVINLRSGGSIDARALGLGPGCVGYVTRQPDFIFNLSGRSPFLRIYVTSNSDTTVIVNAGDSHWHCNDDSFGGTNPTVDIANAPPGQYDVWVGSYQSGVQAPSQLHITELQSNHP